MCGYFMYNNQVAYGPVVKRSRRSPLTAESRVRFPAGSPDSTPFGVVFILFRESNPKGARASMKESGGLLNSEWSEGDRKGSRGGSL